MNALDSPLEALAINYLSYGALTAINNVWAWIAVFTAAVSFWKIRAASVSLISDHSHTFLPPANHISESLPLSPPCTVVDEKPSISESTASLPATSSLESIDGVTMGKYMVYYGAADVFDHGSCDGICDVVDEVDGGEWRFEDGWETVLRMKTEELGCYRFLDLTVFDGRVVRLWDDCCGNAW